MSTQRGHSQNARKGAPASAGALLSIGDVAEATGISVDTLRAWERRYGKPRAVRLPSGHRRYTQDQVRWLRRIAEALAWGHRPSQVLTASDEELDALLETSDERGEPTEEEAILDLVRGYQREALASRLQADWRRMEPLAFFEERMGPLLAAVGRLWANGELDIRHEHFLIELLQDLLRTLRVSLPTDVRGHGIILATLPGETHGLGLQMLALLAALHGIPGHLLGTDVPVEEIVESAKETGSTAVVVSVSLATGGVANDKVLGDLRKQLPDVVALIVGGSGSRGPRRGPRGITYLQSMAEFDRWLRDLARRHKD